MAGPRGLVHAPDGHGRREALYRRPPLEETGPLTVATVDPATGRIDAPFATIEDLRAILHGTQLLCATGEAVFLAAGRGPHTRTGFHQDQTWFLLAVDTRTGRRIWETPLPARPHASERLHFLSARAVGGYLVLVQQSADGDLRLAVHDAQTGKARWNRPLDGERPALSRAQLAVDDRYVYPSAGELVALGLADGHEGWRFEGRTPGTRFSPAAVDDGVVYAVEEGRGLIALDAASGTRRWAEKSRAVTAEDLGTPRARDRLRVQRRALRAGGLGPPDRHRVPHRQGRQGTVLRPPVRQAAHRHR
ncbi:hypothetical protein SHKM778_04390 [Streptomyces sp. KM77-8]|uniref:Pyrrolo-quinoline quinone repeat domain-containing protein n=1 Tax=Streptomyces haneummycinicus TaxID=3074435 RepID=A0AAT9H9G1_9ACTN